MAKMAAIASGRYTKRPSGATSRRSQQVPSTACACVYAPALPSFERYAGQKAKGDSASKARG